MQTGCRILYGLPIGHDEVLMPTRGVVYYAYGDQVNGKPVEHWVARSTASLRRHHPDLPVHMMKPLRPPQRCR